MSDNFQRRKKIFKLIFAIRENFLMVGHKYCLCKHYSGPIKERNIFCGTLGLCCICNFALNFNYSNLHDVKRDSFKLTKMFELLSICSEAVSLGCEYFWEKEIEYQTDNKRTSACEHETNFLFDL